MALRDLNRLRLCPPPEILPPAGFSGAWSRTMRVSVLRAIGSGQIAISDARESYAMDFDEILTTWSRYRQGGIDRLKCDSVNLQRIRQEERAASEG